jgi:hypothetical protein
MPRRPLNGSGVKKLITRRNRTAIKREALPGSKSVARLDEVRLRNLVAWLVRPFSSRRAGEDLPCTHHRKHRPHTACGRLCLHRKRINLATVPAGQKIGIKEVDDGIWLVSLMHHDLGYFDLEQKTLQPLDNPFGTRLSPMS